MSIPKPLVTRLAKQHPHSAALLKAFIPLLEAQNSLVEELPALELPKLDTSSFAQGKPWLPALTVDPLTYLDEAFLKAAPKKITSAAAKGFPDIKEDIRAIGSVISKDRKEAKEIIAYHLKGELGKLKSWAKKHTFNPDAAALLAMHLAAAAAKRAAVAAKSFALPKWERSYCPICGSRPHGSCLKTKEGQRFLQCSLCGHEWRFSRTACPVCEQDSPLELPLFFLEEQKIERAEACDKCKHYILGVDMREILDEEAILELYLICMMPLDILMEEKGYAPATTAG